MSKSCTRVSFAIRVDALSRQHTDGEQLVLTEILEQQYANRTRNSHVTVSFCSPVATGEAGRGANTSGRAAGELLAKHQRCASSHLHGRCSVPRDADHHSQTTGDLWTSVTVAAAQRCCAGSGSSSPVQVVSISKGFMNWFLLKHDYITLSHCFALVPKILNKLLLNVKANAKQINTRRYSVWRPHTKQTC